MEQGVHNGTRRTQWNQENTMEPGKHNKTIRTQWNLENIKSEEHVSTMV